MIQISLKIIITVWWTFLLPLSMRQNNKCRKRLEFRQSSRGSPPISWLPCGKQRFFTTAYSVDTLIDEDYKRTGDVTSQNTIEGYLVIHVSLQQQRTMSKKVSKRQNRLNRGQTCCFHNEFSFKMPHQVLHTLILRARAPVESEKGVNKLLPWLLILGLGLTCR